MLVVPLDQPVDLNGRWRVIHTVERSEVPRYVGLEIEFDVTLSEDGERIRGEGEKFVVGWELVARAEASRLQLDGRRQGRRVQLSIVETSPVRPEEAIRGEIEWQVITADLLAGTFVVTAGNSAGQSKALRRERGADADQG
jgi:hypothetical protein